MNRFITELTERYPALTSCACEVEAAVNAITACYEKGGKLLLCGNGGSAADCDHIVGELMKGFLKKRPMDITEKEKMKSASPTLDDDILRKLQKALPAVSLPHISALNSAFCNDVEPDYIYAQSVFGLGKKGDILIAISTSGNAKNVFAAAAVARGLGMTVISLTGEDGGRLKDIAHIAIRVPEKETFKIQELHLPVYHCVCAAVEEHFFGQ